MDKWKKVGTFMKRDVSGKDMVQKLHNLLKGMSPRAVGISDFAVSPETDKYLEERLRRIYGHSAPYISLQFMPGVLENAEPFTVYRRVNRRRSK